MKPVFKITLPIYYTANKRKKLTKKQQFFKGKKLVKYVTRPTTFMIGMNWYRDANHFEINKVFKYLHEIAGAQLIRQRPRKIDLDATYYWVGKVYYNNVTSDGHNVSPVLNKAGFDAMTRSKCIIDDNVKIIKGGKEKYFYDKDNPRYELYLVKIE